MSSTVMQVGQKLKAGGINHMNKVGPEPWAGLCLEQGLVFCWIGGDTGHIQQKVNQQNFMSKPKSSRVWKKRKGSWGFQGIWFQNIQ